MSEKSDGPVERAADELKLQAWLAAAEFRNPSMSDPAVRQEVGALASLRDELAVQVHLGKLEAQDEWAKLEERWQKVKQVASATTSEVQETMHDLLAQIRDGYQKLRG